MLRTAAAGVLTQINRMAGQIFGSAVTAALFAFDAASNGGAVTLSAILTVVVLALSARTLRATRPDGRSISR